MRSIGVRELRQNTAVLLREVEAGETIVITHHGHPIAQLTPATTDPWNALIAAGEVLPAQAPPAGILADSVPTHPPVQP